MCEFVSSNTQHTQKGPQSKAKAIMERRKDDVSTMFVNPAEQVVRRSKLGHIGPGTNHQNVKRIRTPHPHTKENKASGDVEDDEWAHNTRNPCHAPGL